MSDNAPVQLSDEQIEWLKGVPMSKRAAIVRDHILEHGSVTTQTLTVEYGYGHPPRARGDLQDAGVGVGSRMINVDGKRMAEYYFTGAANKNAAGRVVIPKPFSDQLKEEFGFKCAICAGVFAGRELQADHRVPFMIGGDKPSFEIEDFMPLCASDNRAKSWSCEHCVNWDKRDVEMCETCFWAHPESYEHVEGRRERRINLTFQGDEVDTLGDITAEEARTKLLASD
ncbi:HNH endonuclease signature motif containing protein [Rhodococcus qingshengii]|uniref:HNH endonuclease signature motif containing protein n=1 Tax=Rhodococcus qingshengii TaxID=334542 RepID=UPI0029434D63|nr:HNH endonuclease signature motif containing protein [Rhodococcus qingshengii]WOI85982.1 HNH endonuclease signature motif containing protein [Rhodococcus qingshengii]